jgi:hypothetical protein
MNSRAPRGRMIARSRPGYLSTGKSPRALLLVLWVALWCGVSQGTEIAWLTGPDSVALQSADTSSGSRVPYHVRVRGYSYDSAYVHLYVSVMDHAGRPHTGLSSSDFRITAADSTVPMERFGVLADIPDLYHTLVFGVGLKNPGHGVARAVKQSAALALFAELREEKPDYCALLTFSGSIAVPRLFTSDPLLLQTELSRIHFPGEGLRLISAFRSGRDLIRQTDTSGIAALIMVCDAADSGSVADPVMEQRAAGKGLYPPIFLATVAAEPATWQTDLAEWSRITGGEAYLVPPDREALQTLFGIIMTTLQSQYVITIPAGAHDHWTVHYETPSGAVSATVIGLRKPDVAAALVPVTTGTGRDRLTRYLLLGAAILALLVLAVFILSRRV